MAQTEIHPVFAEAGPPEDRRARLEEVLIHHNPDPADETPPRVEHTGRFFRPLHEGEEVGAREHASVCNPADFRFTRVVLESAGLAEIIVNARRFHVPRTLITYDQIVGLAKTGREAVHSVMYRGNAAHGILAPGESVKVTPGMIFSAAVTDSA